MLLIFGRVSLRMLLQAHMLPKCTIRPVVDSEDELKLQKLKNKIISCFLFSRHTTIMIYFNVSAFRPPYREANSIEIYETWEFFPRLP